MSNYTNSVPKWAIGKSPIELGDDGQLQIGPAMVPHEQLPWACPTDGIFWLEGYGLIDAIGYTLFCAQSMGLILSKAIFCYSPMHRETCVLFPRESHSC